MCVCVGDLFFFPAVIDHGFASVEMLMEEALQDVPSLVKDIQERLRCTYQLLFARHTHIHVRTLFHVYHMSHIPCTSIL